MDIVESKPSNSDLVSQSSSLNSVYGAVRFTLGKPLKSQTENGHKYAATKYQVSNAFKSLTKTLLNLSGKKQGSFVVAIELFEKSKQEPIARVPIFTLSTEVKTFLWLEKWRKEVFETYRQGNILSYYRLNTGNNALRIQFSVYSVDSASIDLSYIKQIVGLQDNLGQLALLPVSATTTATVGAIENVLKSIFDTKSEITRKLSRDMAFVKTESTDGLLAEYNVSISTKVRRSPNNDERLHLFLPVKIEFLTTATRLMGTASPDVHSSILTTTLLLANDPRSATLLDALRTSQVARLRDFLTTIEQKKKYDSTTSAAEDECSYFYRSLSKFLNQRDRAFYYYSFLLNYGQKLRRSEDHAGCFGNPMKADMGHFGLAYKPDSPFEIANIKIVPVGSMPNKLRKSGFKTNLETPNGEKVILKNITAQNSDYKLFSDLKEIQPNTVPSSGVFQEMNKFSLGKLPLQIIQKK